MVERRSSSGRLLVGAAMALLPLGAGIAGAADSRMDSLRGPTAKSSPAPRNPAIIAVPGATQMLAKHDLIGDTVMAKDGVEIGSVSDLILDQDGNVKGIVVTTGGLLGIGGKPVGIALESVDMKNARDGETILVDLNSEEVKQAPPMESKPSR